MSNDEKDSRIAELERQLLLTKIQSDGTGMASGSPSSSVVSEINAVTVKLPEFYEHDPEMWFVRAESQFRTKKITDDLTKFDHLIQCLSEKVARRVRKIILNPPTTDRVAALKAGLMVAFGRTQLEKDTSLLSMRMADLKPSEVIATVEALNADPSTFLRAFILSHFSPEVKTAIANMEFASLAAMGVAADKALEASRAPKSVNAVSMDVHEEIQDEFPEVCAVDRGGASRGRGGGQRGGPSRGGQKSSGKGKTCFFHDRHGLAAFKCDGPPCPFASAPLAKAGNGTAGR